MLYGNTFDGVVWVTPFTLKCRYPRRPSGDFGPRDSFICDNGQPSSDWHKGLDLNPENPDSNADYDIISVREGTVRTTGYSSSAGNYVYVTHPGGYESLYFHLKNNSIVVKSGQKVAQGQKLAIRGSTGNSTGPHLHFGITKSGTIPAELNNSNDKAHYSGDRYYLNPEPILFGSRDSKDRKDAPITGTPDNALLNTNQGKVWTFLTSAKNFNACAAAGIMGNIECESNFSPTNLQNSFESKLGYTDATYTKAVDDGDYSRSSFANDKAGYGLIQWTYYTLKESLYDKAKKNNVSIGDMDLQCEELYHVMDTTMSYSDSVYPDGYDSTTWTKEKNLIDELKSDAFLELSTKDECAAIKYATALFLFECERCEDYQTKIELRYGHSKPIYDTFKNLGCTHETTRRKGTVVATCTEEGYEGDEICVICGAQLQKGKKIEPTGHTWDYSYGGEVCSTCNYVSRYPIGGATPDTPKLKQIHTVLRDILVRRSNTVMEDE